MHKKGFSSDKIISVQYLFAINTLEVLIDFTSYLVRNSDRWIEIYHAALFLDKNLYNLQRYQRIYYPMFQWQIQMVIPVLVTPN